MGRKREGKGGQEEGREEKEREDQKAKRNGNTGAERQRVDRRYGKSKNEKKKKKK